MKLIAAGVVVVMACGDNTPPPAYRFCDGWHQWGNNPSHTGASCSSGQALTHILADVEIDPFVAREQVDSIQGDLTVHYQVPLIDGDDVFMLTKGGTYTGCKLVNNIPDCSQQSELYRLDSQVWSETRYTWRDGELMKVWSFESDWKPEPYNGGFEPMFQPVIVGDWIAVPGEAGSIWLVNRESGVAQRRYAPFTSNDAYVAGAITELEGRLYYNVIELDHDYPWQALAHAWLVAIDPDGTTTLADYQDLVPGAPGINDPCYGWLLHPLENNPLSPPPDELIAPQFACGRQVPGINTAPVFAPDGTMYVVTHAQFAENYSYLVSVEATELRANWARSLRDELSDGCGIWDECVAGVAAGTDPYTGLPPAGAVDDSSSSMPVVTQDGTVLYGAFTEYNGDRGHLLAFDGDGRYRTNYSFGWDTTPAVIESGGRTRIVLKDNNYFDGILKRPGAYNLTSLDASLQPIWQYASTETNSCVTNPDGSVSCTNDHPAGFEWCINAPAVDRDGTLFANSEDGNIYAITADGELRDRFFLGQALGAAYTPVAIDHLGRIYALNAGHLYVVGEQ